GCLVGCFPTQRGKIERLWAVHEGPPPLVAVVRGVPPVAHVNPFSRVGLILREQRQQARRGEPQTDLLARLRLGHNHRPDQALGGIANGVAVDHPAEDLAWLGLPGWRPVVPAREWVIPVLQETLLRLGCMPWLSL